MRRRYSGLRNKPLGPQTPVLASAGSESLENVASIPVSHLENGIVKVTETFQRIPWVVYEECSEHPLAHTEHPGSICCPAALPEGTGKHLEDPACLRSHAALALQAPLFSGVYGMRLPCAHLLREGKLPAWPRGPHMIGDGCS